MHEFLFGKPTVESQHFHLLSASSLVMLQLEISAVHDACCTLHSSWLSSSFFPTILQLLFTSLDLSLMPGPQLVLHGDHMDHSVYRSLGHFCSQRRSRINRCDGSTCGDYGEADLSRSPLFLSVFCGIRGELRGNLSLLDTREIQTNPLNSFSLRDCTTNTPDLRSSGSAPKTDGR